jgi:uracil-DNA glycosylase
MDLKRKSLTKHLLKGTVLVRNQGNPAARLFILAEAPGAHEEREGRPLVGKAGRLLFEWLSGMGVSREDVFTANVVQFRPLKRTAAGKLKDRKPTTQEIEADGRVFEQDLAAVSPTVVLTLGATAAKAMGLDTHSGMTRLRGRSLETSVMTVLPTFHPAYILRNLRDERRKSLFVSDLEACVRLIAEDAANASLARSA